MTCFLHEQWWHRSRRLDILRAKKKHARLTYPCEHETTKGMLGRSLARNGRVVPVFFGYSGHMYVLQKGSRLYFSSLWQDSKNGNKRTHRTGGYAHLRHFDHVLFSSSCAIVWHKEYPFALESENAQYSVAYLTTPGVITKNMTLPHIQCTAGLMR